MFALKLKIIVLCACHCQELKDVSCYSIKKIWYQEGCLPCDKYGVFAMDYPEKIMDIIGSK